MKYSPPPHFLTYVNQAEAQKLHFSTFCQHSYTAAKHTLTAGLSTQTLLHKGIDRKGQKHEKKSNPKRSAIVPSPLSATSTTTPRRIGRSPEKGQDFLRHLRPCRRHGERTRSCTAAPPYLYIPIHSPHPCRRASSPRQ